MKLLFIFVFGVFVTSLTGFSQCPNNGQNPSSAFPVCGTSVFSQTSVPHCDNGLTIPVPTSVCSAQQGVTYTDINPYYYKFACYISGSLEFTITPNNLSDDYDWQLFDITGKNPNAIYTDASLFVACNWSGLTGVTGTSISSSSPSGCAGPNFPLITKAPQIIAGHEYLLMISHFTDNNQSGYNLSFSSSAASLVTDSITPKIDTVTSPCGGNVIYIKLNKRILCSSIAANGSDFALSTNTTIASATGFGCTTGFDTDSIIIKLASPLPTNPYILNVKNGTDGNTLLDICNNTIAAGSNPQTVEVYQKPSAAFTYTVNNVTCKADTLTYTHNGNNGVNKWEWTFDGTPTKSALQTQQVVYTNFATRVVKLFVSNPACSDSITQKIPIANHLFIPNFVASRDTTCPNNPETFTDSSKGVITSWSWDFANGQKSNLKAPPIQTYPVLPINKFYPTTLVVTHQFGCKDSLTKDIFVRGTIPTVFDSVVPPSCAATQVKIYFKQAMICSSVDLDGSSFSISGAAPNSILSASINCINGVGTTVILNLSQGLITGSYSLTLKTGADGNTIINDCGIETLPTTVTFNASGHVDTTFSYTTKLGCLADTVTYHYTVNNNANQWQWTFDGKPSTSNLQNPTVIYTDFTKRNVQLIVSNGVCYDTTNQKLSIIDHSVNANFGSPDTTCGNGGTIFIDSSKGIITNWYWNFGNGATSNLQNPLPVNYPLSYIYATFQAQLVVKNIVGCLDTSAFKNIVVRPASAATMNKMDDLPCSPDSLVIHFNAPMLCNSLIVDGSDFYITGPSNVAVATAYVLNCKSGLGRSVIIKLAAPITVDGYYKLNLRRGNDGNTILNDCGIETKPDSIGFVAYNKVDASFTSQNIITCIEDTLLLNHSIANDENKWTWIIDGTPLGNANFYPLNYKTSGTRNVKLIVSNPVCADTSTQSFDLVFDVIKANFYMSDSIVCPAEILVATDTSTGNISTRNWTFENGQSYSGKTFVPTIPTVNYPVNTGSNYKDYIVQLIVQNATPCYDTAYKTVRVTSNCFIQVPTAFTPNDDNLNDYLYPLNAYKAINLHFTVYNRLGQLVFESKDNSSKWNGKIDGQKQPAGTYVWVLDYTDKDTGKKVSMNGTTVLIR